MKEKKQKKKKFCTIYPVRLSITVALAAPSRAQRQRSAGSHLSKRPRGPRMAVSGEDGLSSGRYPGCHDETTSARAQLVLNSPQPQAFLLDLQFWLVLIHSHVSEHHRHCPSARAPHELDRPQEGESWLTRPERAEIRPFAFLRQPDLSRGHPCMGRYSGHLRSIIDLIPAYTSASTGREGGRSHTPVNPHLFARDRQSSGKLHAQQN
ncbi:hypothetical protein DNTS_001709 [Danionella cerebrum]|uniref:Uncharacterized protein n=1 Tax=Danionella cerebrum TaxID=2873325 RepID=A0A553QJ84_9TELE|nr:hypothetical protein DNTS_001709 [Danionella translucida]